MNLWFQDLRDDHYLSMVSDVFKSSLMKIRKNIKIFSGLPRFETVDW